MMYLNVLYKAMLLVMFIVAVVHTIYFCSLLVQFIILAMLPERWQTTTGLIVSLLVITFMITMHILNNREVTP